MTVEPCPVTRSHFREIANKFFQDVSFQLPELTPDLSLQQHVVTKCCEEARAQGLDVEAVADLCKISVDVTRLVYARHEKELQKAIAVHTAYMFIVDDHGHLFVDQLQNFHRNILLGRPQGGPILEGWAKLLPEFDQYYGAFCANGILVGTLDFVATEPFEIATKGQLQVHPSARKFAHYFRLKSSIPEPYTNFLLVESIFPESIHLSQFIQAVPDLMDYVGFVNDILSFYKESIVQTERNNYVYNYAAANGQSVLEALETLTSKAAECVRNVRSILASQPELLKYVETYFEGLIAVHIYLPRYMLSELNMQELAKS